MDRTRLLLNPRPINKDAYRAIAPAKAEDKWTPTITLPHSQHVLSKTILPTQPIPRTAPLALHSVVGRRRGRLTVVGYSALQVKGSKKQAKWVVRCDCGNYEHRTNIIRWLCVDCEDMCVECHRRRRLKLGTYMLTEDAVTSEVNAEERQQWLENLTGKR